MNKNIQIMIEMQRYWDNVLHLKNDIARNEKSILQWKKLVDDKSEEMSQQEVKIKELKVSAKEKEIDLSGKDEQIGKLEKKKDILKNEKELTALDHELSKVNSDKDLLENDLIELFDNIEQSETRLSELKSELAGMERQTEIDIKGLKEQIVSFQKSVDENQKKFDGSTDQLSVEVKSKFLKLTKSHNGKAIAAIEVEICSACNFQVPFNIIQDVTKANNIVSCTNCGRFLYKA
jgi:uncharacterized protein